MKGPFLSPPANRPSYNTSGLPETNPHTSNAAPNRGRTKPPPLPISLSPGDAAFRLLCHVSKIGGVIGKSGAIVKQLERDTGAKIRVYEAVPACEERIALFVGPKILTKKIAFNFKGSSDEDEEEFEVSPAQEALIRVFERVLEVDAKIDGGFLQSRDAVFCRLLAATSQIGAVMGKGGTIIKKIRKESGAKISVLPSEQLPACASPADEVIQVFQFVVFGSEMLVFFYINTKTYLILEESATLVYHSKSSFFTACGRVEKPDLNLCISLITGDILAVKKALVAVSRCLQDCPPVDKVPKAVSRHVKSVPIGTFPDEHVEFPPHRSSLLPPTSGSSVDYSSRFHPLSTDVERIPTLDPKRTRQEVAFRMLCSTAKVGGVIGKGGTIVRALEIETGTSISVGAPVAESDERVITVYALENPESQYSPAQNAVVRVFTRSVEAGIEKGQESGPSKGTPVSARLLVTSNQVGYLLGKGGAIISEMRKVASVNIWIYGGDQVPKCASENDEVVQIIGEFKNVQNALFLVTGRLRGNLFPGKMLNIAGYESYSSSAIPETSPYGRARRPTTPRLHPSVGLSHTLDQQTTLTQSMDHLGLSHNLDRPPSPRLLASQTVRGRNPSDIMDNDGGLTSLRGDRELDSGSKSAIVTNTTVEIVFPEHVIGSIYGESGSNLTRLRQISGAEVTVHPPQPGKSEVMVIISGMPDQTQAAQSLLQAFILSGQSSPDHLPML
ncbi:hypothetical protein HHK36_008186 [Tetracentron sinense]|uniref:K Homology domain-containing protein n=1 Tax=Tetracentron sinense TaxID=13715 RepID=A0A834ZFX2_TETSI|nr:hypothetical protein HHK36_008186 [Tetracentron sinense]